jgi:hypothetical protein
MLQILAIGIILYFVIGFWAKADNEKMNRRYYKEAQEKRLKDLEDLRRNGASTLVDRRAD